MKHLRHKADIEKKDYLDMYDSMKRLRDGGLIRFGGVSNFRLHHLKEFPEEAFEVIITNYVPCSLVWRFYDIKE